MNRESVDAYLRDGCGRCEHYRTPACKVHRWEGALVALRELLLASGLEETMKWGSPCYTLAGKNVAMLVSFVDRCALQLFKGAALEGDDGLLVSPGPNSRFVRIVPFRSREEVEVWRDPLVRLLARAIELERSGVTVAPAATDEAVPEELAHRLATDPPLARAFAALTPGRRRSHALHVAGAKQAATRARRAEACVPEILAGRGFRER